MRSTLVSTGQDTSQPLRLAISPTICDSGTFSQLPLRTVLPLPRMSLALPRMTMVSGGPLSSTSSTV
ncbi:hypothetical protein D3C81_1156530 [compost metagenome]